VSNMIQIYIEVNKQWGDDVRYKERRLEINKEGCMLDDQKAI